MENGTRRRKWRNLGRVTWQNVAQEGTETQPPRNWKGARATRSAGAARNRLEGAGLSLASRSWPILHPLG